MTERRFTADEVVSISSRYLTADEMPSIMLATLKHPDAFTAEEGGLEAMLAKRFLEIADRLNEQDER